MHLILHSLYVDMWTDKRVNGVNEYLDKWMSEWINK